MSDKQTTREELMEFMDQYALLPREVLEKLEADLAAREEVGDALFEALTDESKKGFAAQQAIESLTSEIKELKAALNIIAARHAAVMEDSDDPPTKEYLVDWAKSKAKDAAEGDA